MNRRLAWWFWLGLLSMVAGLALADEIVTWLV